jgi:hypothetical protein
MIGSLIYSRKIRDFWTERSRRDVLWYLPALAEDLNVDLSKIAGENIDKLHSRQTRGKLLGGGDNR